MISPERSEGLSMSTQSVPMSARSIFESMRIGSLHVTNIAASRAPGLTTVAVAVVYIKNR